MERSERRVQVVMSWGGNPQAMSLVGPEGSVRVGEGADFAVPCEAGPFTLVEGDAEGRFVVHVPAGAACTASDASEPASSACNDEAARTFVLGPCMQAEVQVGEFTFHLSEGEAVREKAVRVPFDPSRWRWTGVSFAAHAVFLGMLLLMPPGAGALSLDLTRSDRDYVRVHLDAIERAPVEPPQEAAASESGGAAGQATAGEEGRAGAVDEPRHTGGGARSRGPSEDTRIPLTREQATTAGALGTLAAFARSFSGVTSPYGAADALGFATDDAYGDLMADASGFGPGTGGLGMRGVGRGGGCTDPATCGAGTIGLGGLVTGGLGRGTTCTEDEYRAIESSRGHAAAVASCTATGIGGSRIAGEGHRRDRVPVLRMLDAQTAGGLAREQIRLVVTRNRAQIRSCYERSLAQRPDLEGRVTVRWMIQQDGHVVGAQVQASDLHEANAESCISAAVARWQFPAAPGATAVSYPFMFQSS